MQNNNATLIRINARKKCISCIYTDHINKILDCAKIWQNINTRKLIATL